MRFLFSLLTSYPYIDLPLDVWEWTGILVLFGLLIFLGLRYSKSEIRTFTQSINWMLILCLLALAASLFFGIKLPDEFSFPLPDLPLEFNTPIVMLAVLIPVFLAGILLGKIPGILVGFFSGMGMAAFITHNLVTPVQYAIIGFVFALLVRQRYRSGFFKLMRHPLAASFGSLLVFFPVQGLISFLEIHAGFSIRVSYGLNFALLNLLKFSIEILIAGLLLEGLYWAKIIPAIDEQQLIPSPTENSLSARFLSHTLPPILLLFIGMLVGVWYVSGNSARNLIEDQLASTSAVVSKTLPVFLENGQYILEQFSVENSTPDEQQLQNWVYTNPFFNRLILTDISGSVLISASNGGNSHVIELTEDEITGCHFAVNGVNMQVYPIPSGDENAYFSDYSFIIPLISDDQINNILIGHANPQNNAISTAATAAFEVIDELGGQISIIEEKSVIIAHTDSEMLFTESIVTVDVFNELYERISPSGKKQVNYAVEIPENNWKIVISLPETEISHTAFEIALPLMLSLAVFMVLFIFIWQLFMRDVTGRLHRLSNSVEKVAAGQLSDSLKTDAVDEIGKISNQFEKMRIRLKSRLEDMERLLGVSQNTAANLNIGEALFPVLNSASEAINGTARIVLQQEAALKESTKKLDSYGAGLHYEKWQYLDEQLFELMRDKKELVLQNATRFKHLQYLSRETAPGALIAFPLLDDEDYHGVFWLAMDHPRKIEPETVEFMRALSAQASASSLNARLFRYAEIGRKRLESILSAVPDAILVFDRQNHLQMFNPAAVSIEGLIIDPSPGLPANETLGNTEFYSMLLEFDNGSRMPSEIQLPDAKVYAVHFSKMSIKDDFVGTIFVLRDITYYKELDEMKSDFVSTVSHDLRAPLKLVKGYLGAISMMGDVTPPQQDFLSKMSVEITNMSELTENLLDLGRIEAGIGLKIEPVSARKLAETVIDPFRPDAKRNKVDITLKCEDSRQTVFECDEALLKRALHNLIDNAIRHSPENGIVTVNIAEEETSVVFEVIDQGNGFSKLDIPYVFEKFYWRDKAREENRPGLGLSIVKSIVERHSGETGLISELGRGSTFYMKLPRNQN